MILTNAQQKIVEENIGLVYKVISDKVHHVNELGIYTYDDIFQIGCIGLCKAVATDKGGCLSTYAYRLIWHEICDALNYASLRTAREFNTDPGTLGNISKSQDDYFNIELQEALKEVLENTSGVTAKGIYALCLMVQGYSCKEIGVIMDAPTNHVTAWISKARKHLREQPTLRNFNAC